MLAIRNKDIVKHFCIYFYFQTQKPCPSFIYRLLTELAFCGHFRNFSFLHFCILMCYSNAFFLYFFSFLYCSSIWKKGALPVDTYTTCPADSAKRQCKIMHLIKIKFMKERIHGFILELHVYNSALFTSMVFKSSEHRVYLFQGLLAEKLQMDGKLE